eukprot:UN12051
MGSDISSTLSTASTVAIAAPVLLPVLVVGTAASSISSSGADPDTIRRVKATTDALITKWCNRDFNIKHVEIWTRAVKGSSAAAGAAIGGIWHTFLLIETGPTTFLLERVQEGIRFVELTDDAVDEHKSLAKRMYLANNVTLSSKLIAEWAKDKQTSPYNLLNNNCIHFAYQFGVHFRFSGFLFNNGFIHFFGRARAEIQRP